MEVLDFISNYERGEVKTKLQMIIVTTQKMKTSETVTKMKKHPVLDVNASKDLIK